MATSEDLISEIGQIIEQYRQEVPGRQTRLPKSVKERVMALYREGMKASEVSKRTGLSYYTVLRWMKEEAPGQFERLSIGTGRVGGLISKTDTVTVSRRRRRRKVEMVTVSSREALSIVMPSGVRIEGLSARTLLKVLPHLGGGR